MDLESQLQAAKEAMREIGDLISGTSYATDTPNADLEERIASLGLFPYEDWSLKHFPSSLHSSCGKGLGLWQYPNQLVPLLILLQRYQIESYLEIGVAAGGTLTLVSELLNQWCAPGSFRAVGCDPAPPGCVAYLADKPFQAGFKYWLDSAPFVNYAQLYSEKLEARCPVQCEPLRFDCVLVDGDHSFEGAWGDFQMALRFGASMIILHDVVNDECPGVIEAWRHAQEVFADDFMFFEFAAQYDSVREVVGADLLGIGVSVRKTLPFRRR